LSSLFVHDSLFVIEVIPMARPIGFSAFLKLLQLPDGQRKTELKKKLGGGGGFQYWRPLQLVAPKAIAPTASIPNLSAELELMCSGHQRTYNKNAFAAFSKWREGKLIKEAEPLPMIEAQFGNSGLIIRMRPEVCFELDGALHSMSLWATTKPALTVDTLSVGLFFLAAAYKANKHGSHRHLIFDTVSNVVFREADILPTAIYKLKDKADAFKKDWDDLNPKPEGPTAPPKGDQPILPK